MKTKIAMKIKLLNGKEIKTVKQFESHFSTYATSFSLDKNVVPKSLNDIDLVAFFENNKDSYFKQENNLWVEQKTYGRFYDDNFQFFFIIKIASVEFPNKNKIIISETNKETYIITLYNHSLNKGNDLHIKKQSFFVLQTLFSNYIVNQKEMEKEYLDFLKNNQGNYLIQITE